MKKRMIILPALLVFIFAIMSINTFAASGFDKATSITFGQKTKVSIDGRDCVYFTFVAPIDGVYTMYATDSGFDNNGNLFDKNRELICADDNGYDNTTNFQIKQKLNGGEKYYLRVDSYNTDDELDTNSCYIYVNLPTDAKTNNFEVTLASAPYYYNGNQIKPQATVRCDGKTLVKDVDYKLYYQNNTEVGQGRIYVVGIGAYEGIQRVNFNISLIPLSKCDVTIAKSSYTYSPSGVKPTVTVKLNGVTIPSTNYSVRYSNNKSVGTATITVTGKGSLEGTATKTFTITKKTVKSCFLYNQIYTGKKIYPEVYYLVRTKYFNEISKTESYWDEYVLYKKDRDYTIKVSGDGKSLGDYTATITFKGNYTGTVKKSYKIQLADVQGVKRSNRKVTSIDFSWSKVIGADGYKIYRYNSQTKKFEYYKKTTATTVTVYRVNKNDGYLGIRIRAYKKVGDKIYYSWKCTDADGSFKPDQATFTLKKCSGVWKTTFGKTAYYQYQVSKKSDFSTLTKEVNGEYKSISNKGLKAGTKYYVRAREYKIVGGKTEYGKWSTVKSFTA